MKLAFTKMNGLGNDIMVVEWPKGRPPPAPELVRRWSDRRRGVGFDQLMMIDSEPPAAGDASYRVFNADGGEVQQCGNGVRCVASLLAPRFGKELTLVSPAGAVVAKVLSSVSSLPKRGASNDATQRTPLPHCWTSPPSALKTR